jgi:hypothetical protein
MAELSVNLASEVDDSFAGSRASRSGIWKRGSDGSGARKANTHSL